MTQAHQTFGGASTPSQRRQNRHVRRSHSAAANGTRPSSNGAAIGVTEAVIDAIARVMRRLQRRVAFGEPLRLTISAATPYRTTCSSTVSDVRGGSFPIAQVADHNRKPGVKEHAYRAFVDGVHPEFARLNLAGGA